MQYLDFDLEIGEGGGREYPVKARFQGSQVSVTLRFPYDELALRDHLKDLRIALLRSGGPPRRALSPEVQTVQTFGQQLFDALVAGDVRALYDVSRRDAEQLNQGLRLKLHIHAPELAALPWEYLYDHRGGEYLCLSSLTPLVRTLDLHQAVQPLRVVPPLRILGVIASPSDLEPLDVQREQQRMQAALQELERAGRVTLTWLSGQTWRDLRRALTDGNWHILHFMGHGGFDPNVGEGVIALANEEGRRHLLTATQMGTLLAGHRPLRLVLLNACEGARSATDDLFSSTAATLARRGIPAVLAMQEEITDRAAIEFTRTFYEELALGRPVDAAVAEARAAIHLGVHNSLEWGTPVLYLRAPDGRLFDLTEHAEGAAPGAQLPEPLPAPPSSPAVPAPDNQKTVIPATASALETESVVQPKMLSEPETPEAWLEAGQTATLGGRENEALAAYQEALTLNPLLAPAQVALGETLLRLHRDEEALTAIEQAIRLGSHSAQLYALRGAALTRLKRYDEALAAYERALTLNTRDPVAWSGRGEALLGLKQYAEALAAYERALQLGPPTPDVLIGQGEALRGLLRDEEALEVYQEASRLDPTSLRAQLGLAEALLALQRAEEALVAFQAATQIDPRNAQVYRGAGAALHALRHAQEALAAYNEALQRDPKDALAHLGQGDVFAELNWQQEALAAYDQAIALDPGLAQAYRHKGNVLVGLHRREEALVVYEQADERDPTDPLAYRGRASLLATLQRHAEALPLWELVLHRFPADADALQGREAAQQELAQQEAERQEQEQQAAAKREAERLEQERQAAARREAERLEQERQAATKREVERREAALPVGTPLFTFKGHTDLPATVAWSPDGTLLASGSRDHTIRIWDVDQGQLQTVFTDHWGEVNSVAWSPNGKLLASASDDKTVRVWDVVQGKALGILQGPLNRVKGVAWSPDGTRLASGSGPGTDMWDVATWKSFYMEDSHGGGANCVAWSPDGTRLASWAQLAGDVSIWDARTHELLKSFYGASHAAWSPDGTLLATNTCSTFNTDGLVNIYDCVDWRHIATFRLRDFMRDVVWSPDGRRLASGSGDEYVHLWDVFSKNQLAVLKGHTAPLNNVTWSPDGMRLASASSDKTVRLWDAASGQVLSVLTGHTESVWRAVWSPNGKRLATASSDKTVRTWKV